MCEPLPPLLKNFRRAFSPDLTDCPWVSEDGQGHSPPKENLEKTMLGDTVCFFEQGDRGGWKAFGITDFYKVTKSNDQYSNDLVI